MLILFRKREFRAWWFQTSTPTFLAEMLVARGVTTPKLEGMVASEKLLGAFDGGRISSEALLFQAGYLTMLDRECRCGE